MLLLTVFALMNIEIAGVSVMFLVQLLIEELIFYLQ